MIRTANESDSADWERMRQAFWPSPEGEHAGEIARFFGGERRNPLEVLLAIDESGRAVGFAELCLRLDAEGCYSGRVAYLEAWFVDSSTRGQGVGRALVRAAEDWAREQGCMELASDSELGNAAGESAHKSVGFKETNRVICYRKDL